MRWGDYGCYLLRIFLNDWRNNMDTKHQNLFNKANIAIRDYLEYCGWKNFALQAIQS